MSKKLLVVVDYQKDFVSGALGFPGADELDKIICGKIERARQEGYDVAFTFDTHQENYLSTSEGKNLPVPHCIAGTEGHALFGQTAAALRPGDACYQKPVFGSAELFDALRSSDYQVVELCGLVSNICVLSNAVLAKTALPEAEIIVDPAATASHDPALHLAAIQVLGGIQVKTQGGL
ncbi:MAG: cysteine hydrolase [Oscillospiraceae bacterium]|nr:cysteine hydrolase [Oscillospiraceae bacterium]